VTAAVAKAVEIAKKNFMSLKLYKGTFPHESQAKVGGSNILLIPASAGTGLIAGGVVRTVLEVAGVTNALSKSLGSANKINTAYATLEALKTMEHSKNWVTRSGQKPKSEKPAAPKKAVEEETQSSKPKTQSSKAGAKK
jgi:small subunit ribosomal protein S5